MHYPTLIAVAAAVFAVLVGLAWHLGRARARWRLLGLAPAAHTVYFERTADVVFVLNGRGLVVDSNPAACVMLQLAHGEAVGRSIGSLAPEMADTIAPYRNGAESGAEVTIGGNTYDLRVVPLRRRRRAVGQLVLLRDITRLTCAERELHQIKEAAAAVNSAKSTPLATSSPEIGPPKSGVVELPLAVEQSSEQRDPGAAPAARSSTASASPEERSPGLGLPLSGGPSLAILLVEDNKLNEDLALTMLQRLGYSADVAHDGLEALEALRSRRYDVVLMDIQMPRLDGLGASRRIRAELPPELQPRIIAMTANALRGDREMCLAAGMDDYLSKPVSTQMLRRALSGERVSRPAMGQPAPAGLPTWDPGPLKRLAESLGPTADVLLTELVGSFFDEANQMLPDLAGRLASGDTATLRRYAHTLKSHGATFGGQSFEALCRELERATAASDLERAAQLIPRVEAEFAQLRAALSRALPLEG